MLSRCKQEWTEIKIIEDLSRLLLKMHQTKKQINAENWLIAVAWFFYAAPFLKIYFVPRSTQPGYIQIIFWNKINNLYVRRERYFRVAVLHHLFFVLARPRFLTGNTPPTTWKIIQPWPSYKLYENFPYMNDNWNFEIHTFGSNLVETNFYFFKISRRPFRALLVIVQFIFLASFFKKKYVH